MTRMLAEMPLDKWQWSPSPLPGQVVLVTSRDSDGRVDVAPKSWVSIVAMAGPRIGFGCNLDHQTARNVVATSEFGVNIPGDDLADIIWAMPDAPDRLAGLTTTPAVTIGVPLITECSAHIECRLDRVIEFDDREVFIVGVIQRIAVDAAALAPDDIAERYSAIKPFFFLEPGWSASLGSAQSVGDQVLTSNIHLVIDDKSRFQDLLRLADEQGDMSYLSRGDLFVMETDDQPVAVCVVTDEGDGLFEVQNLAVRPEHRRHGHGSAMLAHVVRHYQGRCSRMVVCTGDSPITVPFYESCGFAVCQRIPRGIADAYEFPIFENGVQLVDKICLMRWLDIGSAC